MECLFCKIIKNKITANIIYENEELLAFLDDDPINEGHVLIIPKKHVKDIDEIPSEILLSMMKLSKKIITALKDIYSPDGYSIMQNGGSFNDIGHFHLHIFPRYKNDGFGWTFSDKKYASDKEVAQKIKNKIN